MTGWDVLTTARSEYSAYEATQMQRRLERTIRKQKQRVNALEDVGLEEDATAAKARLRTLNAKYKGFSKAAGLREKPERLRVAFVDEAPKAEAAKLKAKRAEKTLQNSKNIAILKEKIANGEISTKIRPQVQARHIEGTAEFEKYLAQRLEKGQTPQSILTLTQEEAQALVDRYHCTGEVVIKTHKDGALEIREYTDADRIVGKEYTDNEYRETNRINIIYAKKGTHIVPVRPKEGTGNG